MQAGMPRVLVVDDDPDIRAALVEALKIAGYEVGGAATGAGALALCKQQCPDLVLLDQMLPDVDGLEVCRRLRDDPALDDLRIIMLTSSDDKHAAFEAGVDDYLNKDIDLLNLPNRVKLVLEIH